MPILIVLWDEIADRLFMKKEKGARIAITHQKK